MMLDGTDLPPLHSASRDGDLGAVRSLLKRTDASARDAWGETPLHWASTAKVAECLVAAGASVNVQDPTGDTPLHWAVENANAAVAGLLLESNAEVNAANRRGDTPLHAAASSGDWGILRLVLDKGGDANLGVYARSDAAWAWLDGFLTAEKVKQLLPEAADLVVERYRLPKIRSLNFLVRGLLEEGVAASTRQDGQAKALGEWLRARVVPIPSALVEG